MHVLLDWKFLVKAVAFDDDNFSHPVSYKLYSTIWRPILKQNSLKLHEINYHIKLLGKTFFLQREHDWFCKFKLK